MALIYQMADYPTPPWKSGENADAIDHGGAEKAGRAAGRSSPRALPGNKGCILLVDDDRSVRETLGELLEDVGFASIQAGDAAQALIILRQGEAIDVLVTDLTMPGDDGIALIRQARAIRNDLPAILLTGYAEQATSVTTMAGGNFHVLRKPVESGRLIQQIELLSAKA
jgi:DNA-binding NtrC family response regulator